MLQAHTWDGGLFSVVMVILLEHVPHDTCTNTMEILVWLDCYLGGKTPPVCLHTGDGTTTVRTLKLHADIGTNNCIAMARSKCSHILWAITECVPPQKSHNTKHLQQTLLLRGHLLPLRLRVTQHRHCPTRTDLPIATTILERRSDNDAEVTSSTDV